jgi:pimeloyl-ACP methyl ester carboxylesterase
MASFVLVHGAWHGAWCWRKVVSRLSDAGHRAVAIDLPSHGADRTPRAEVTMQRYAEAIADAIDAEREPVILVGHSMGGLAISQAAELRPQRIRSLAYLSAFIPVPGSPETGRSDPLPLMAHVTPGDDGHSLEISPEDATQYFYADCSDEDTAFALGELCPQATGVFGSRFELSETKFASVPRDYIECLNDAALPPERQQQIHQRVSCRKVYRLAASHSPFFSIPGELCEVLCDIASQPSRL